MPQTHFERLVRDEMTKIAIDTVTEVKPGQVDRHSVAWGKYAALTWVLEKYREAARTDEVETDRIT